MIGAAGRCDGHIPAENIIWIPVDKYVALFTYLLQEKFHTLCMLQERNKNNAFLCQKE